MNDDKIYGPWSPVGESSEFNVDVPRVVKGIGAVPIQSVPITITRRIERRPVWQFVGYEERTVES